MSVRLVQFLALIFTAIALAPALAHLFSISVKMRAGQNDYFVMQQTYNGWSLLGVALFAAIAANALAGWLLRADDARLWRHAGAAALMAANLVIFFLWTFPANQATANWTQQPAHWQALRAQWEYSHAVNAGLTFGALCLSAWAAIRA